jgi:hypothetical protein
MLLHFFRLGFRALFNFVQKDKNKDMHKNQRYVEVFVM